MDANDLFEQTCKRTTNYGLCISFLRSNPRSSGADVRGLALIMVGVIEAKAKGTLSQIKDLIKASPQRDDKQPLSSCAEYYDAILSGDVPEAIQALKTGNYKFAEQGSNNAALEANMCENRFSGKSPLTKMNKLVHDVAVVAAAITRVLLTG
ncbi:Pectinesterase inhibitor 2 [Morus notabilis]|uniref:Pectinesterase inhibitor 2 n=1 Tax=Morus notabilis TaxID=981085 RepID=W9RGD0_9ROSA|nr:cell wall / vacuolar inhibitor of fructosidase 1 [Morus notabilis]EXB75679.1 Pectinesterase inhibitor 2 [Morus notabilis]